MQGRAVNRLNDNKPFFSSRPSGGVVNEEVLTDQTSWWVTLTDWRQALRQSDSAHSGLLCPQKLKGKQKPCSGERMTAEAMIRESGVSGQVWRCETTATMDVTGKYGESPEMFQLRNRFLVLLVRGLTYTKLDLVVWNLSFLLSCPRGNDLLMLSVGPWDLSYRPHNGTIE
ncbi:hypothetical protein J6590_004765 [Homalodisca vitripennis]|nr:hypothetical protein J6590_004765 [Homalodisca vitripennis]